MLREQANMRQFTTVVELFIHYLHSFYFYMDRYNGLKYVKSFCIVMCVNVNFCKVITNVIILHRRFIKKDPIHIDVVYLSSFLLTIAQTWL